MCSCVCESTIFTVISGSFRKHLLHIGRLKSQLEGCGVVVLSPKSTASKNPNDEFVVLDSDPIGDHRVLQDSVFAKIRRSTFLVVANVDGYIGRAAVLEMGYAIGQGIAIYTIEAVDDPNLKPYCQMLANVFPSIDIDNKFPQFLNSAGIIVSDQIAETVSVSMRQNHISDGAAL